MIMKLQDYMQIKEAAEFLGVSPATLRNWERSGKVVVYRHPINRYRLFKQIELEGLLATIEASGSCNEEELQQSAVQ